MEYRSVIQDKISKRKVSREVFKAMASLVTNESYEAAAKECGCTVEDIRQYRKRFKEEAPHQYEKWRIVRRALKDARNKKTKLTFLPDLEAVAELDTEFNHQARPSLPDLFSEMKKNSFLNTVRETSSWDIERS